MKYFLAPLALALLLLTGGVAQAQSRFAGNYDLASGYESGPGLGTFGMGTATASRSGAVAYTVYYPRSEDTGAGSGTISKNGTFTLNNGVTGSVKLVSKVIDAIGEFTDPFGSGFFGLIKR